MTPRVVDKGAKRKEILRAALKVLARTGRTDFKMIEVAEAAGVGKGTLYEYFPSKLDLIIGCFADMMEDWGAFVNVRMRNVPGPVSQLRTLIAATFEYFQGEQDRLQALFDFYAMGIPRRDGKPALIEMSPSYREMIQQVAGIIRAGMDAGQIRRVNPELAASVILAALDGLFFQIALQVVNLDDEGSQRQVGDVLLAGLLPEPREG